MGWSSQNQVFESGDNLSEILSGGMWEFLAEERVIENQGGSPEV